MTDRLWSDEQVAVFDWFARGAGNMVVRARAGTGKTTTLVEGVVQAPEQAVLLAAFNKSIASELTERVPRAGIEAKTLHSLGYKYVRQRMSGVRIDENGKRPFELAGRAMPGPGVPQTVVSLVARLHTKAREVDPWVVHEEQDAARDRLVDVAARFDLMPNEEDERNGHDVEWCAERAHRAMVLAMERTSVIDFADMIFLPLAHGWVRPWFDHVVIDEAQDMTDAQLAMAVGACKRGGRVCLLGDDRQNLYSFRGTRHDGIDFLKAELAAAELGLTTTYRCARRIVALAAEIVPDYRAAPDAAEGVVEDLGYGKAMSQVAVGDFVLSRKNAPLVRACMALLKRGIRARIKGRDVGKGVLALIRQLGAADVGQLVDRVDAWAAKETRRAEKRLGPDAAAERVSFVLDQAALIRAMADGAGSIAQLETRCADLFADDAENAAVMCSTVHRAKGLEASTVWLLRDTFRYDNVDEDNIRYVAITRAKQRLVWVAGEAA